MREGRDGRGDGRDGGRARGIPKIILLAGMAKPELPETNTVGDHVKKYQNKKVRLSPKTPTLKKLRLLSSQGTQSSSLPKGRLKHEH